MDPIWTNPTLLQEALRKSKELSSQGFNRTNVPQNPAVPNEAAKGDFAGIMGAPGDPTVGMAPPVHPFQGVPLATDQGTPPFRPGPTPNNVVQPPEDSTLDQNVVTPGGYEKPEYLEASNSEPQVTPASYTETPVAAATGVFDPATSTVRKEGNLKSFFDNPASTDALLAFGAAMLQAPNFSSGLGAGAEAVRKSIAPRFNELPLARRQEMEINAQNDLARLRAVEKLKAQYQATSEPSFQGAQDYYDQNGKLWRGIFRNGVPIYFDENGQPGKPEGLERATDSMKGPTSRAFAKDNMDAAKSVTTARDRIGEIDRMISLYPESGAGAGLWAQAGRYFAEAAGMDVGKIKVSNMQELSQLVENSGLLQAQSQRGLGQLTEGERVMIRASLPGMGTNRETFMRVMNTLKAAKEREVQMYSDWQQEGGLGSFRNYYLRRMKALDEQTPKAETPTKERKPLSDIFN